MKVQGDSQLLTSGQCGVEGLDTLRGTRGTKQQEIVEIINEVVNTS